MHWTSIYWRQIVSLTVANLKSRYRKTIAGFVWVVLNPIVMFGVQSLVFRKFLNLQTPNYSLFLLSGLLPWIFISQSLEMCTPLLASSARILKSFPVHPLVFLAAQLLDNLTNFLAAFFLIFIPLAIHHPMRPIGMLLLPLCLITLATGVLGLAWVLATIQVFLRDTRFLVSFALSVGFFLTPIFYPRENVPTNYRFLVDFNPLFRLIDPFRYSIYAFDGHAFLRSIAWAALVALASVLFGAVLWNARKNTVYFYL